MKNLKRAAWRLFVVTLQIYGLYELFYNYNPTVLIATITFGDTSSPSDYAKYFDAVFTQSLPLQRKTLTDNIGADNAILRSLMKGEAYESYEGGSWIEEPLMTGLAVADAYDGYDELPDAPVDGVTAAVYQPVQIAIPVSYSMKEIRQNRKKVTDLVKTKQTQSEEGIKEGFAQALIFGAGSAATRTAKTGSTGASWIEPLHSFIDYTPTTSRSVGNINQNTSSFWRNKTKTSAATTVTDLLLEFVNLFNTCSLGTGGSPNLVLVDQITFEAINAALFIKYRQVSSSTEFEFNNTILPFGSKRPLMVMDEKMIDVANDLANTTTKGSAFFINTRNFKLRYLPDRDFTMLTDENGNSFAKPLKGDSRLGHIGWDGQLTCNARRKQGVLGNIGRTLTNS